MKMNTIQKSIGLVEYVETLSKELKDYMGPKKGSENKDKILEMEAAMFFKIFRNELSDMLIQAYELQLPEENNEQFYKSVVILFRRIGNEATEKFLDYLKVKIKEAEEVEEVQEQVEETE